MFDWSSIMDAHHTNKLIRVSLLSADNDYKHNHNLTVKMSLSIVLHCENDC